MIDLVGALPKALAASIFVVQHVPAHADSQLYRILGNHSALPVRPAEHDLPIEAGTIYTARADHHLLVEPGRMLLTKGPKENRFRPAVDALFRSAAYAYRERVVGVVLSGALNDGSSGLWTIKHMGGTTVVQSVEEAIFDSMPTSAKAYVDVDYELPSVEIGKLLGKLGAKPIQSVTVSDPQMNEEFLQFEIDVARGKNALKRGVLEFGSFTPLTCPDCHGAMTEYREGNIIRYRCHTGHGHTAESLLAGIDTNIEKSLWEAMRGMEEGKILLEYFAHHLRKNGDPERARRYSLAANKLGENSQDIKSAIFERSSLRLAASE